MRHAASESQDDAAFLRELGERVRRLRGQSGLSRRALAAGSGLSERYIAQLEGGRGNVSVLLLRRLAQALNVPVQALLTDGQSDSAPIDRRGRLALIGLRGAGKTTLGAAAAARLGVPFIELDREVETAAGVPLGAIFELYGQEGYRHYERRSLERVLEAHAVFVLATGGSIVADAATFELLLARCLTVWLRASPDEHMERVIAQGDLRPMAGNTEAMADVRRILAERDALYRRADLTITTSGRTPAESTEALLKALARANAE